MILQHATGVAGDLQFKTKRLVLLTLIYITYHSKVCNVILNSLPIPIFGE